MQTVLLTSKLLYADFAVGTISLHKWYVKDYVMAPLRYRKEAWISRYL